VTRSNPKRAFALLWAILFLLGTAGEGFGWQPCPFHDSFQGAGEAGESGGSPHDHDHHHSSHGSHSTDESAPAHGGHAEGEPCTHVDACQTASGAVLPVDVETSTVAMAFVATPSAHGRTDRIFVGHPPHFLPFSNAPPLAADPS
jgi:hypothetical protein